MTMTVDTAAGTAVDPAVADAVLADSPAPNNSAASVPTATSTPSDTSATAPAQPPTKRPARKTAGRKAKTVELVLTVTGTADGEWRAELKQGGTYLARDLAVAAAAVSRAAKELHQDIATPIDSIIEEARIEQAAKVSALEAELEAARRVLADLD